MGSVKRGGDNVRSEIEVFDGRDNRREIMILLERLGTNARRSRFLTSLIPHSPLPLAHSPVRIDGPCDPLAAYFMMVAICNEMGVSINEGAKRLQETVRKMR